MARKVRFCRVYADVAQLVEHFTRNEGVRGSSPRVGSKKGPGNGAFLRLDGSMRSTPSGSGSVTEAKGASSTSDSPGATTISMREILQNGWTRAGCRRESKRSGSSPDPSSFMAPRSRQIPSEIGRSEDYAGGLVHELREGLAQHVLVVAGDELPEGPRSRLEQSAGSSGRAWGGVYAAWAGLSLRRRRSLDFSPDFRGSSSRR